MGRKILGKSVEPAHGSPIVRVPESTIMLIKPHETFDSQLCVDPASDDLYLNGVSYDVRVANSENIENKLEIN